MSSTTLLNLFEHNLWANLRLFDRCAELDDAQLAATDPGAYGSIHATLAHLASAERYYVWALQGQPADWERIDTSQLSVAAMRPIIEQSSNDLITLAANADELGPIERKRENGEIWIIPAPFIMTQAIHHANEHRTNITTILATLRITDCALSGWDYWLTEQ